MAGIVNKPLGLFRRPESPRPLHTRWGDVGISVPTEGSWNQYDNPYRPAQEERQTTYGPGFVPHCHPSDKSGPPSNEIDEDHKIASSRSSTSRRNSLSLGALRPGRLSVRLASRPKHLRGEAQQERDTHQERTDFAYKPIRQDYPLESTEKSKPVKEKQNVATPPFKYIPTNGRYLEEIPAAPPRSQSAMSHRSSLSRRDSFTESLEERLGRRGSHQEDDCFSLRSSVGDSSDSSSSRRNFEMMPRRRTSPFVPADRRRASLLKPMTLAMVPDPEDLFD